MIPGNRIHPQIVGYGLYLYFLGLSFRNTAKALSFFFAYAEDKPPLLHLEIDAKVQTNENS